MENEEPKFHVRSASSAGDDASFILAAWDSTLPFLASVGAGEMWGHEPFSQREGEEQDVVDVIRRSEENEDDDSRRWLVAELYVSSEVVKVGAAIIRDALPKYLNDHAELKSHLITASSVLYLEVLIADHRGQQRYKGAGKALVDALKLRAQSSNKDAVYVDVWAGNNAKLNRQV